MKEARKFRRPVRLAMIVLMAFIGHVSNECVDQAATCPQFASSCNLESASINGNLKFKFILLALSIFDGLYLHLSRQAN